MKIDDLIRFSYSALHGYRVRTLMLLLAMAIGVAAVVILTGLGEGARRYVVGEFASLGTNLVIVLPGRSETTGEAPPILGETPRPLTIDDALALNRSHLIRRIAPINVGSADISRKNREREAVILGSTAAIKHIRQLEVAQGRFFPSLPPKQAAPLCVIGSTLKQELFGNDKALGEWLRIGDRRFRIVGILASRGVSIGIDTDEMVIIPIGSAQQLFNTESLFRIVVEARSNETIPQVKTFIRNTIKERHEGEEDITVITQDAILSTFDRIFGALTLTVGGIAAISLLVAGILIMNVMLIAVTQRTTEIGLLKAIGATPRQIQYLFITEALLLSLIGALLGLVLGLLSNWVVRQLYPILPMFTPSWAIAAALGTALLSGITFGALPARRAARLNPVDALARR